MTNLATNLTSTASKQPEQDALRVHGQGVTYAPAPRHGREGGRGPARQRGRARATGSPIILPNVPAFPVVYWGSCSPGGVVVPMNPLLKAGEIDYFFTDSGAQGSLRLGPTSSPEATKGAAGLEAPASSSAAPWVRSRAASRVGTRSPSRTSAPTTTPRSSSTPRARPAGPRARSSPTATSTSTPPVRPQVIQEMTPDDVVMGCLPLFHVFGLVVGLNAATVAGASLALHPPVRPRGSDTRSSRRSDVTIMQGVPTMYARILQEPADSDGMDTSRACAPAASGGSAMPLEVMRSFEDKFGCIDPRGYGLTETSPLVSFNMARPEGEPGTIGVPSPAAR